MKKQPPIGHLGQGAERNGASLDALTKWLGG